MCYLHLTKHFIRQAVEPRESEKKSRARPVRIAPITLVVTKVIARRIRDNRIVARMLTSCVFIAFSLHRQLSLFLVNATARSVIARRPTEMPKITQKNVDEIVITPVILKNAVITPMITLATREIRVQSQSRRGQQFVSDIFFTSRTFYALIER